MRNRCGILVLHLHYICMAFYGWLGHQTRLHHETVCSYIALVYVRGKLVAG